VSEGGVSRYPNGIILGAVPDHLPLVEDSLAAVKVPVRGHIEDLQGPGSGGWFSPEMNGQEGPVIKALPQGVPGPREQEVGPCPGGRCHYNHQVPSGHVRETDFALNVLQMIDNIQGAGATVGGEAGADAPPYDFWEREVAGDDGGLADMLQGHCLPLLRQIHHPTRVNESVSKLVVVLPALTVFEPARLC